MSTTELDLPHNDARTTCQTSMLVMPCGRPWHPFICPGHRLWLPIGEGLSCFQLRHYALRWLSRSVALLDIPAVDPTTRHAQSSGRALNTASVPLLLHKLQQQPLAAPQLRWRLARNRLRHPPRTRCERLRTPRHVQATPCPIHVQATPIFGVRPPPRGRRGSSRAGTGTSGGPGGWHRGG